MLQPVTCSDELVDTTIQNYIRDYQGTKKLIEWEMHGCAAFNDHYKSIKNITIVATNMLLTSGVCTLSQLLNNTEYSNLVDCQRMYSLHDLFFFLSLRR